MTVGQVMEEVRGDVSYFRHSGGGVTLSGGEPMAQFRFTAALLEALRREGIHTAIETSGQGRLSDFLRAQPMTDLWLWDVKSLDGELYEKYTGLPLAAMLDNLRAVHRAGGNVLLRSIFIPELHDNAAHAGALADLLDGLDGVSTWLITGSGFRSLKNWACLLAGLLSARLRPRRSAGSGPGSTGC